MTMQAENTTARHTMARPPPLLDLLGASFVFNTPIKALVWDGASVCLGLADGAIAMLFAQWPGGPALGHRPSGGVEIMAGEAPPPPPRILAAHRGAVSSLARIGSGGIVSGGADGRFLRITEGIIETIADQPRKTVSHVAAGRGGRCAMVAGHQVDLFGADARRIAVSGAVKALAYDPSGLNLAISHADGVVIATDGVRRLRPAGPAGAIAWNSDGTMFAIATPDGEITITRIDMTTRPHRITPRGAPTALLHHQRRFDRRRGRHDSVDERSGRAARDLPRQCRTDHRPGKPSAPPGRRLRRRGRRHFPVPARCVGPDDHSRRWGRDYPSCLCARWRGACFRRGG